MEAGWQEEPEQGNSCCSPCSFVIKDSWIVSGANSNKIARDVLSLLKSFR